MYPCRKTLVSVTLWQDPCSPCGRVGRTYVLKLLCTVSLFSRCIMVRKKRKSEAVATAAVELDGLQHAQNTRPRRWLRWGSVAIGGDGEIRQFRLKSNGLGNERAIVSVTQAAAAAAILVMLENHSSPTLAQCASVGDNFRMGETGYSTSNQDL